MRIKNLKLTAFVNLFGLFKIPLVFFVSPRVIEAGDEKFIVKIPLNLRTKNHLNSMYFGAMGIGAELSVAAAAVQAISESKQKIDFIFKDFSAQYLKRGDGDVHFICEQVLEVKALIEEAKNSSIRLERKFKGYAVVPNTSLVDPIMTYELTLSVRNRSLSDKTA
jgi:hypothetical protein